MLTPSSKAVPVFTPRACFSLLFSHWPDAFPLTEEDPGHLQPAPDNILRPRHTCWCSNSHRGPCWHWLTWRAGCSWHGVTWPSPDWHSWPCPITITGERKKPRCWRWWRVLALPIVRWLLPNRLPTLPCLPAFSTSRWQVGRYRGAVSHTCSIKTQKLLLIRLLALFCTAVPLHLHSQSNNWLMLLSPN